MLVFELGLGLALLVESVLKMPRVRVVKYLKYKYFKYVFQILGKYFVFSEPIQKYLIKVFQIHIFKSILYLNREKKYLLQPCLGYETPEYGKFRVRNVRKP